MYFLVMVENHGYGQVVDNPNLPLINDLAAPPRVLDELVRDLSSELDQLSGNCGRIELRCAERQLSGLAQLCLYDESRFRDRSNRHPPAPAFVPSRVRGPMPRPPRWIRPTRPAVLPA
jgi:hypothetical protein